MKRNFRLTLQTLLIALSLFVLTGCLEIISAVGASAYVTGEYLVSGAVTKTVSYDFGRIKKALLVALCKMKIYVDKASPIEGGEEIFATAEELEIRIELKEITSSVTRISVKAEKNFLNRDKATAQEILQQTNRIAEELISQG
ncbi:MAG: hypothetical protein AMK69_07865 [Nitrospira bacterium SG8_3]|nr:MAG: hypothetical protein AMK69_07865 [Nitrospira bacterium SG8_3]